MNATRTQLPDFGNPQAPDAIVSFDRMPTQRPVHNFLCPSVMKHPDHACRTWPAGQRFIYVVDTYPRLANLAQAILEADGYPTCAFDNRAMAWHAFAFARPKPALLITDNLDGDATARAWLDRCRSLTPDLKTLLVDHRHSFRGHTPDWADGLLCQPYAAASLVQEVKRLYPDRLPHF